MAYKLTSQLRTSRMKAEATKRRLDSEDTNFRCSFVPTLSVAVL